MEYDRLKESGTISKPMISRKMMTKILSGNFETSFLECEKMTSQERSSGTCSTRFVHVYISNNIHEKNTRF